MNDETQCTKHQKSGITHFFKHLTHKIGEGWCIQGDPHTEDRKRLIQFNLTSNTIANLVGGNFYTGFLILLNADDGFIGLMTMLVFACNLLQLVAPMFWENIEKRKKIMISLRLFCQVVNIFVIGLIPFLSGVTQVRLTLLAVCVLTVNVCNALLAPALSVWHMSLVPQKVRVAYFSVVSVVNGVSVALLNLGASFLVDLFKQKQIELYGLLFVRVIALLLVVYDIYLLSKIKEVPVQKTQKINFKDFIVKPWKEKAYLRTVFIVFTWNVAIATVGSYYMVHLLKNVGVSYSFITLVSMLNVPVLFFITPIWRKIFARSSTLKPLAFALLLFVPRYFIGAFVSSDRLFLFPLGEIWAFIFAAGINYVFCSISYVNIPKENQTLFIGFYATSCNLGALLGSTLGRTFVTNFSDIQLNIFGTTLNDKQILMLVAGVLVSFVAFGVYRIWQINTKAGVEA